jgi:hypothetical protein
MRRPLRLAVFGVGIALVLWGCAGIAMALLGWNRSSPEALDPGTRAHTPSPATAPPEVAAHEVGRGEITMVQVFHDGGTVGGLVFLVLGIALTSLGWPRRGGPSPGP